MTDLPDYLVNDYRRTLQRIDEEFNSVPLEAYPKTVAYWREKYLPGQALVGFQSWALLNGYPWWKEGDFWMKGYGPNDPKPPVYDWILRRYKWERLFK